jgi:Tfp pilus assembly protein PilF
MLLLPALLAGCQTDQKGVQVDLGAAMRAYKHGLDRKPGREQVERMVARLPAEQLNDLGVLYEREGNLDRAAWAYQQAVWRSPRFALAYVNLGNVLRKQGKTEEALFRYRQAMNADRANFEAANNFADLCAEKGVHVDEAIGCVKARLDAAGPRRAYGLDTLGCLYHQKGDNAAATEAFEAALKDPGAKDPKLRSLIEEHLAAARQASGRAQ